MAIPPQLPAIGAGVGVYALTWLGSILAACSTCPTFAATSAAVGGGPAQVAQLCCTATMAPSRAAWVIVL